MNIDVAFTPFEVQALSSKVCIVIDVIRSTSSLTVIMSRNPRNVLITATVQRALKHTSQQAVHPLLCGERGGLLPEGFDHGNSPREFVEADLAGRNLVFTSSNGARAVAEVCIAPHVLLGSFLNASYVVETSLQLALRENLDILIVCAGRQEKFALDDAYCAGYLISLLAGRISVNQKFSLGDGGQGALGIFGYFRDPRKLLTSCGSGEEVINIGLEEDISFLLEVDQFQTVPTLIQSNQAPTPWGFSLLA